MFRARVLLPLACLAVVISQPLIGQCQEHIELFSAKELASELGATETWVLRNFRVNLWARKTNEGKGRKVGEMLPGSRAVILEEASDNYKVQSPLDGSVGWVNKIQVKRTLYQDVETRERCTPGHI